MSVGCVQRRSESDRPPNCCSTETGRKLNCRPGRLNGATTLGNLVGLRVTLDVLGFAFHLCCRMEARSIPCNHLSVFTGGVPGNFVVLQYGAIK